MKTDTRKVHRNFKLDPKIDQRLRQEAERTKRTQTIIVEMALAEMFKVKTKAA